MPWPKQKKDLARFKELTTDTTIIMGRGTWDATGMPKPLPNRTNIVVSTQDLDLPADVIQVRDLQAADLSTVDWCIGGAQLIGSLWDQIDELHLTHLFDEYECDTTIDLNDLKKEFYCERSQLTLTHTYEIWKRRTGNQ
jgi:dihydrofolate reductase